VTPKERRTFQFGSTTVFNDDVLSLYEEWSSPNIIVSDGGYGVSGFKGDTHEPATLTNWYKPHIEAWSRQARAGTTLWFWNTEIGWATVHPMLDANGWEYLGCNVWDKGIQHIAGNCNLPVLKGFPVVTEVCVQYVKRPQFHMNGQTLSLKEWLRLEWERTGLPLSKTNDACEVANAATRKYLTKDHLWYAPPPEVFAKLVTYANEYGQASSKPYFSIDGHQPITQQEYAKLFATFNGKYGITNVWQHPPLHNNERIRLKGTTKYAHLNQKPLKLIQLILEVSSSEGDVVWEPFGGLCTVGLAAHMMKCIGFSAEVNAEIYQLAVSRFNTYAHKESMKPQPLFDMEQFDATA
jgi:site-specific DNA-methyltransferase (adenine-specific)